MTEMSLVIRSGSYGSLHNSINSGQIRRNSKMLLVGSREKERRLSSVFKIVSRRKIWMMLLLVTSAAVALSFIFAISKDVDQPARPEADLEYSDHLSNSMNNGGISTNYLSPPPAPVTQDKEYSPSVFSIQHANANANNETPPPAPSLYLITIPSRHPCENFSLPPQPLDPKRTGPRPCDVCYVPVDLAMAYMPALPSVSPVLKNLDYVLDDNLLANESNGGSIFGGHTSLQQRDESFDVKESMTVHCGFVKGKKPGLGTGFDIDEADLFEMEQCHGLVIASAIFGNYDIMQQPRNIGEASRRTACFYMFVDEETETSIKNSSTLDFSRKVGLWRVVVVQNLPYADARRNGKVPKLLLHRLFPNARFSLWIDGKLELVVDPYQILERFLWRNNATFAISRHYRRFDVFEEAEANKAAGKYDNFSIDYQIEFYRREGLTHFAPAKYPITSDVPEGCVIIREHTPITNLFTCLWFNEVDRFTARDQLSFSTVRDKIMSQVNWTINMFLDCERRNFVVQAYHRDLLERRHAFQNYNPQPISAKKSASDLVHDVATRRSYPPPRKPSTKRARDRRSSSRRHRFRGATGAKDPSSL